MSNQGELAAVEAVDGMEAVDGYTVIGEVVAVEAASSTLSDVIGEVVAVEAAVPPQPTRAPPPPPALYESYEYYMDGDNHGLRHMGRLHLDPVQKKCSWKSHLTGKVTPWHGEYHRFPSGNLVCFFDYEGRENSGKYTVIFPGGQGKDYRGRTVRIGQIDLWQYDTATGNYQYVGRG